MSTEIRFHPDQLRGDLSPGEARALFRNCVQFVEIETFSYCNRKCWFCPNAALPYRQDRQHNQYLDEALYLRILDELASIDYAGQVQFGRYNEPLADRVILTRIRQASDRLPGAWLYTHTNGDFLTRDYLAELRGAGLRGLALQSYLGNGQHYDEQQMQARQAQQLRQLGLRIVQTFCSEANVRHYHLTNYPGLRVTIDARNFDRIGNDRGGLVDVNPTAQRTAPCLVPFTNLYVDWTGNTMPCCNLRSDMPEHAPYVACRLQAGASIFEAYAALHAWRRSLMRFGPKASPCNTCRYEEASVPPASAERLEQIFADISGEGNPHE